MLILLSNIWKVSSSEALGGRVGYHLSSIYFGNDSSVSTKDQKYLPLISGEALKLQVFQSQNFTLDYFSAIDQHYSFVELPT